MVGGFLGNYQGEVPSTIGCKLGFLQELEGRSLHPASALGLEPEGDVPVVSSGVGRLALTQERGGSQEFATCLDWLEGC